MSPSDHELTGLLPSSTSSTRPTFREVWRTVVHRNDSFQDESAAVRFGNTSLRTKLKLANLLGVTYYFTFSVVILVIGSVVSLPTVYTDVVALRNRKLLLDFIFINMMLNYLLMVFSAKKSEQKFSSGLLPTECPRADKSFCNVCNHTIPTRAKHCVLCNSCVLKRDHHCFFAGCCVGFHNQRYFAVFCVYASIGAGFSLFTTMEYLRLTYADVFSWQFYRYFLPWCVGEWLFFGMESSALAMMFLYYMSLFTFLTCGWFGCQQFFFIYRGQTAYEYFKGIQTYRTNMSDHFRSVFGPFWAANLIIPVPWFRNAGNGKNWNTLKYI